MGGDDSLSGTDFDWDYLSQKLQGQEIQEDECGNKVKRLFIGEIIHNTPSGKIYMPWSTNVSQKEADADEDWWNKNEEEANRRGLVLTTSEGDPNDIIVEKVIEDSGDVACNTKKVSRR